MTQAHELTNARAARLLLAGYIIILLLLQLFSFDAFPAMLAGIGLDGVWSYIAAIALVVVELLALPFLLQMKLSKKFLNVSMISGGVALLVLSILEVWAFTTGQSVLFGATFDLPGGSWSILLLLALWLLFAWGAWNEIASLLGKDKPRDKNSSDCL